MHLISSFKVITVFPVDLPIPTKITVRRPGFNFIIYLIVKETGRDLTMTEAPIT